MHDKDKKNGKGDGQVETTPAATTTNLPEPLGLQPNTRRAERIAQPDKQLDGDGHSKRDYPDYRVRSGHRLNLSDVDPDDTGDFEKKKDVAEELARQHARLQNLQERLFAESKQSLLIVLQAMDTGGKDGTIRVVFDGVNPQGCEVWAFKVPTPEEAAHDFLWRCHMKTPARGMINIFNRSYYEDVLVVRVHNLVPADVWGRRYQTINEFEKLLVMNNTTILKFFLHISKDEQKKRLQARIDTPDKNWKFSVGDLPERARWNDYMAAYEDAVNNCTTDYAPWYVIPSNKKWYRNLVIARTIADTLEAMNPQYPPPAPDLDKVVIPD